MARIDKSIRALIASQILSSERHFPNDHQGLKSEPQGASIEKPAVDKHTRSSGTSRIERRTVLSMQTDTSAFSDLVTAMALAELCTASGNTLGSRPHKEPKAKLH